MKPSLHLWTITLFIPPSNMMLNHQLFKTTKNHKCFIEKISPKYPLLWYFGHLIQLNHNAQIESKKPRGNDIEWSNPYGNQATHFRVALKALTLEQMWGYVTILFVTTCNYMSFATTFVITFVTTHQFHQIWGGFATILQLICNYYLFRPFMWIFLRLYSSTNKPPWPISFMCNQNLVTN